MLRERNKKITGSKETRKDTRVFYSLCNVDILRQAKEMKIPRKKLTPDVMEKIKRSVEEEIKEYVKDVLQDAISDAIHEKEG